MSDKPKLTKMEYKAQWQKMNKEKMALYARNYYHKRCSVDPDYKIKLCEKVKARYIPKNKQFLDNINDTAVLEIVDILQEPFIFPDPTGIDKDMNSINQ